MSECRINICSSHRNEQFSQQTKWSRQCTQSRLGRQRELWTSTQSDAKPACNKEKFFDMISCNSHARGTRDGQNGSFMQMKMDTKTFWQFSAETIPRLWLASSLSTGPCSLIWWMGSLTSNSSRDNHKVGILFYVSERIASRIHWSFGTEIERQQHKLYIWFKINTLRQQALGIWCSASSLIKVACIFHPNGSFLRTCPLFNGHAFY